jgi:ABC-type glycerol-3-phosphate transport system permease component
MKTRIGRSAGGNILVFTVLLLFGAFFMLPVVYTVVTSFKPLNEIFIFPPRLYVLKPTFMNFVWLNSMMADFWVPLTRYIFNTLFVTAAGTSLHILFASMAAYPMAKHPFPGRNALNRVIVLALLFVPAVIYIPQYIILAATKMINTYLAMILPALQSSLGLYLMMNFMKDIPEEMLEAAKIDGAREVRVFWSVVMPNVKPAWLTLLIFSFQTLWVYNGGGFIYNEELKTLPAVMATISAGGAIRTGVTAAAALMLMIPPVVLFVSSQSRIIETMSTSGLK